MSENSIRVLVVDDSAVMRTIICNMIEAAPGLSIAGKAHDGAEAIERVATLRPDVITLDMQMPGLNGLAVLDAVLKTNPTPVVMVSALTTAGAAITLEALDRGAVDYVAKPERGACSQAAFAEELIPKIRAAASVDVARLVSSRKRRIALRTVERAVEKSPIACPEELADKCVALGISTGGPPALTRLLSDIRPPMPPMVIVQHMPAQFTGPLAARLDSVSAVTVREAAQGDVLEPNVALIAPGGKHLEIVRRGSAVKVTIRDGDTVSGHKPSVDVMMASAAKAFGANCLGVIMTGMGRDGANGCRDIRAAGGFVLGQDDASSDVYGMNKVAFVEGNVDQQFSLNEGAVTIMRRIQRLGYAAAATIS